MHPNTLANYEAGRLPDAGFVVAFCRAYGISETWLLTGKGPMGSRRDAKEQIADFIVHGLGQAQARYATLPEEQFALIPVWSVEASSGFGAFVDIDEFGGRLAFSRAWLRSTHSTGEKNLHVVFNRGDSNAPDINHGDAMLIDRGVSALRDDAYYVFDREGVLLVKMIERTVEGTVILKPRNPAYSMQTLSPESAASITVFGRVLWRGGLL